MVHGDLKLCKKTQKFPIRKLPNHETLYSFIKKEHLPKSKYW